MIIDHVPLAMISGQVQAVRMHTMCALINGAERQVILIFPDDVGREADFDTNLNKRYREKRLTIRGWSLSWQVHFIWHSNKLSDCFGVLDSSSSMFS